MDTDSQDNMEIDGWEDSATQQVDSPVHVASSPPKIKTEPAGTPREGTPQSIDHKAALPRLDIDDVTRRAVTDLKKDELGLRSASRDSATPSSAMEPPKQLAIPAPAPKRPAPKASTKKGTAAKKPPAKKRKAEAPGTRDSTPTAKTIPRHIKSKSGTPRLSNSPAPSARTSNAADTDAEGEDTGSDEGVFCICRKGDNHTWMIGCDGGCEDWFHGKCVGVSQSNGELIDKYICPNCEATGQGVTTYLPQCRRPGCQKPARVNSAIDATTGKRKNKSEGSSKYCSDECGELFMTTMLERSQSAAQYARGETTSPRTKRKKNLDPSFEPEQLSDDDLGPRGGPLKRNEVAGMMKNTPTVDVFRSLGSTLAPPTPPPTSHSNPPPVSDEAKGSDDVDPPRDALAQAHLTSDERTHLANLATAKSNVRNRRAGLADWERFLNHIFETTRRANTTADGKKSSQAVCGYDSRVAWNEAEFALWAATPEGRRILHPESAGNGNGSAESSGDRMEVDGETDSIATPPKTCTAKRCSRHDAWQRNATGVLKAERAHLAREAAALDAEEQEVWERAGLRARKRADVGGASGGWVEEVA
jgi:COMPASS component SPP1